MDRRNIPYVYKIEEEIRKAAITGDGSDAARLISEALNDIGGGVAALINRYPYDDLPLVMASLLITYNALCSVVGPQRKSACRWNCADDKLRCNQSGRACQAGPRRRESGIVSKRKYKPGGVICTLDELLHQDFVFFNGKILHRGFFLSWSIHFILNSLGNGCLRYAVREEDAHEKKSRD